MQIKELNIAGVPVCWQPSQKEVMALKILVLGGVSNYAEEKQGIENIALFSAIDGGSVKYPRQSFHTLIERKGISIGSNSGLDFSMIGLQTLMKNKDLAFDMLTEALLNPLFEEKTFQQNKEKHLASLKLQESDPDDKVKSMSLQGFFAGQDYAKDPEGELATVEQLTLDEVKDYFGGLLHRGRLLITVVGGEDEADVIEGLSPLLKALPEGSPFRLTEQTVNVPKESIEVEEREIATNYLRGISSAPARSSAEFLPFRLAMSMLYDRFFVELRTKRNLSYAPSASLTRHRIPYSLFYISTTRPVEAMEQMKRIIVEVKASGFTEKELREKKEGMITSYFMSLESASSLAGAIGSAMAYGGASEVQHFISNTEKQSLEAVNKVFSTYLENISWYYLGDKQALAAKQ